MGVLDAGNRARANLVTTRNARATRSDHLYMSDTPPQVPNPDDPEDPHLALISALVKIFGPDECADGPSDE